MPRQPRGSCLGQYQADSGSSVPSSPIRPSADSGHPTSFQQVTEPERSSFSPRYDTALTNPEGDSCASSDTLCLELLRWVNAADSRDRSTENHSCGDPCGPGASEQPPLVVMPALIPHAGMRHTQQTAGHPISSLRE